MSGKRLLLPLALAVAIPLIYFLRGAEPDPASTALPTAAAYEIPRIPLNQATPDELMEVPGIGTRFAEDILAGRPLDGYTTWEQVDKVRGVGPARLRLLQEHFSLPE